MRTVWYVEGWPFEEFGTLQELVESFANVSESDKRIFNGKMIVGQDKKSEIYYYYKLAYDSEGHASAIEMRKPVHRLENVLSKEELADFVNDWGIEFAFVWNGPGSCGKCCSYESEEVREEVIALFDDENVTIEKVGDIYEEDCSDLKEEFMNGCDIYKVESSSDEGTTFIAYYD